MSKTQDEFLETFGPYFALLRNKAVRFCAGNEADAEDLFQTTLTKAWKGFHTYKHEYPSAWLMTIMRNQRINEVRAAEIRPKCKPFFQSEFQDLGPSSDREKFVDPKSDPSDAVVLSEPELAAREALKLVKPVYRTALALRELHGHEYEEIARIMGLKVGTVMSRIHRGRLELRRHYESVSTTMGIS